MNKIGKLTRKSRTDYKYLTHRDSMTGKLLASTDAYVRVAKRRDTIQGGRLVAKTRGQQWLERTRKIIGHQIQAAGITQEELVKIIQDLEK